MRTSYLVLIIGIGAALSGCERSDNQPDKSDATDLNAADVAWSTGWQIWKLECPSPDIDGMQLVVLDEGGDAIAGNGVTFAVNQIPEQSSVLRVAVKITGKAIEGRMSANNISTEFNYPDVFKEKHTSVYHCPVMENNAFILITESAGESTRGPIVRSVVLRLTSANEDS